MIKSSSYTTDGSSRQDCTLAFTLSVPKTDTIIAVIAVWDGHGIKGDIIATTARDLTYQYFLERDSTWIERTDAIWTHEFTQLFENIHNRFQGLSGGSTASIAFCFVQADGTKSRLIHANVGDSPIYIIDKATRSSRTISANHAPDSLEEANRLHSLGPQAMYPVYMTRLKTRIFITDPNNQDMLIKDSRYENYDILWKMRCGVSTVDYDPQTYLVCQAGHISVSRALADFTYVPHGMICTPHVSSTVLGNNEFVAIMSDGITDVNKQATLPGYLIDTIATCESLDIALKKVTIEAHRTWLGQFGTPDDASIAVLD